MAFAYLFHTYKKPYPLKWWVGDTVSSGNFLYPPNCVEGFVITRHWSYGPDSSGSTPSNHGSGLKSSPVLWIRWIIDAPWLGWNFVLKVYRYKSDLDQASSIAATIWKSNMVAKEKILGRWSIFPNYPNMPSVDSKRQLWHLSRSPLLEDGERVDSRIPRSDRSLL